MTTFLSTFFVFIITLIATQPSVAADEVDQYNYCQLTQPGQRDITGRYCTQGYGVIYDGYIVDNACHSTIQGAYDARRFLRACSYPPPAREGYCELLPPTRRDYSQRFCPTGHAFTYGGYIVDNACFTNIDRALEQMRITTSCNKFSRTRNCEILQPKVRDRNNRWCETSYGVAYQGVIVNNQCYFRLDDAINAMERSAYCY
ncbi:MAG: hypothetical protein AB7F59_01650 [Bdellovibrionales bacterium]